MNFILIDLRCETSSVESSTQSMPYAQNRCQSASKIKVSPYRNSYGAVRRVVT